MLWLLRSGGFPLVFIALFGTISLATAVLFVRKPTEHRREFISYMSRATLFSVGAGVSSSLAAVCIHVVRNPEWARSPDLHLIVIEGVGESMAPAILGFTLLSLTAFLTALGSRRSPREE